MADGYQRKLCEKLLRMPLVVTPPPYKCVAIHAVRVLLEIGFAPDNDLLSVLSSSGRGVFDCTSGERVAFHCDENRDELDETRIISIGMGPWSEMSIRLAGLHGGARLLLQS